MNATEALNEFLLLFPEFEQDYIEHIELNEVLLSHVFYEDTIARALPDLLHKKEEYDERLRKLFLLFEKMAFLGDHYIQEVLHASILMRLSENPDTLKVAYKYMRPKTREFSNQIEAFWGRLENN